MIVRVWISETAVQNGLMAAGYGLLFFTLITSRWRSKLRILTWASLFACVFNILYDSAIHLKWAVSLALFVRLLPAFEACWLVVAKRRDGRLALVSFACSMIWCCSNQNSISAFGYLTVRNIASILMASACVILSIGNRFDHLEEGLLKQNLWLQTVWKVVDAAFSLTAWWYNETWARRGVARWMFVFTAMGIILAYVRSLQEPTNLRVHRVAVLGDRLRRVLRRPR